MMLDKTKFNQNLIPLDKQQKEKIIGEIADVIIFNNCQIVFFVFSEQILMLTRKCFAKISRMV